jgi:agmatine deiminase
MAVKQTLRMPAEWEPHEATWLAWPHERSDWPGKFEPIKWVYGEIIRHLSQVELVRLLVANVNELKNVTRVLLRSGANLANVELYICETNRSWCRDFAPIFVHNAAGRVIATDWIFNGWAKYDNWQLDNAVTGQLAQKLDLKRVEPGMVLEGGSIDVNGSGLMLSTEECLLSDVQARNPGLSRADLEKAFAKYLGIEKVIWLHRGIVGDDTHGHVDDLARFVSKDTVVTVVESDRHDDNYEPLRENLRLLKAEKGLNVATLPMPAPVYFDGQRLPASYANFYIANEIVVVPTFNDPNDRVALNTLAKLFPARQIIGIHCVDLVLGLGTLHCMSMQQPSPKAK